MLRIKFVGGAIIVGASLAAGGSALAAPSDETIVTFEILGGTLDIDGAASADLGNTAVPGVDLTGSLGAVTVTDTRAAPDASWEATVVSTNFTTGAGTPEETVLATELDYWSGPATATTGTGTFTPEEATAGDAAPLDNSTGLPAFTHTGGTGNNTTTWAPGLVVHVPLDSVVGVYTATVTHSVA